MVHVKHEQTGMSLEAAVDELQKDFESAMEAVLGAIRMKHGVTEQQMSQVALRAIPPRGTPGRNPRQCCDGPPIARSLSLGAA